jgi:hypothetical protein
MRAHVLTILLVASIGAGSARALEPGTVLDASTAAAATDLLPPELVARYQAGEYRSEIAAWPDRPAWSDDFAKASAANAERLDTDERGTIVERAGGALATGIYGLPFRIDPADPKAGAKVIWNAYYSLWRVGSTEDVLALDWVGRRGLERQAIMESKTLYYEGAPPARAPDANPLGLAAQQIAEVTSPADLNGTTSLAWRYRAADKPDQTWTYVPALRRVRQVSPANRSDGFLGSDLSQDDGAFFDGKPEDFEWRLVGEREGLILADPRSLAGAVKRDVLADGTLLDDWPAGQHVIGYQDPEWTGLPWAPRAPVLVRRKLWVVEATPRDPYYLFRRIEITLDQETFQGVRSRKFDAQGALLRSLQFIAYAAQPVTAGGETVVLPASSMGYVGAVNVKADRATIAGTVPPRQSVHRRRGPLEPKLFALERLGQGK